MKTIKYTLNILAFLMLSQIILSAQSKESYVLHLKVANKSGNFEFIDNTAAGTIAIQRERISAHLSWEEPQGMKAGWYRASFLATSIFQATPEWLEEDEPFIISAKGSDNSKTEAESSYAYKDPQAKPVTLHSLTQPLLDPTLVQTWYSCQTIWIGENSRIELAVRRPLLIVGDIRLDKVTEETEHVHLTLTGAAPFNMFTDNNPVGFHYEIQSFSNRAINGNIRFILKDALDGSEQTRTVPVKIKSNTSISNNLEWTPKYGAYLITGELIDNAGKVLCSQHRYLTYSPYIDVNKLPDSWPVAFHIDRGQPEAAPPVGDKWLRLWGGWSEMEKDSGQYDWSLMDKHVKFARENGYRLLWVCTGPAGWTLPDSVRNMPRDKRIYTFEEMDKIRPFLHAFWHRYASAGVIGAVEIGNEPNAHPEWTPEIYARFGRNIYDVTHQDAKDVKVIGISMSGGIPIDYMEKVLNAGMDSTMDIASLHLYEIGNPVGQQSIERKTRLFKQKLEEHGLGDMPVWNTESGCPMQLRQDGVIVPQEELNRQIMQRQQFDASIPWRVGREWRAPSEILGAAWMIRASYQQFAMGVKNNFMFQWDGSPHFSWVYDWRQPEGNVMPKIIVVATGVMSKMLENYGPQPTSQQPAMKQTEDWLVFGHRYQGPEGIMTIVYLHPAKLYAGSGDKVAALAAGDHESADSLTENALSPWLRNQKPKPVTVQVPVSAGLTQVKVMDMLGRDTKTVQVVNGFAEISANEIPQYVIETK